MLNSAGINAVQNWISGASNQGVVIASTGTTDGIDFHDCENNPGPILNITWNDENCSCSSNQLPTADYDVNINLLSVSFFDQSTDSDGNITAWFWDFGDGNSSTQANPTHHYTTDGNYSVVLSVTDDNGAIDSVSQSITVTSPPTSWTALTFDDFEGGWGNWLDGGSDAKLSSSYAIGSRALNLQDNSSSSESRLANSLDLTRVVKRCEQLL